MIIGSLFQVKLREADRKAAETRKESENREQQTAGAWSSQSEEGSEKAIPDSTTGDIDKVEEKDGSNGNDEVIEKRYKFITAI